jgi:predicted site-specific integrase-resolvase
MEEYKEYIMAIQKRKRAIIYCRVSTDKQEQDGESLEYQEEKGRKYAELRQGPDPLKGMGLREQALFD